MNKLDEIAELFIEAENEQRDDNEEKCLELKQKYFDKISNLTEEEKRVVYDYLDSVGC